jgi:hypothetical protein
MGRLHVGLAVLAFLGAASTALAGELPSSACLAPLVPGAYDPGVRDALVRNTQKETVVEFCIVSGREGFSFIAASASLFDARGHLIGGTKRVQLANIRPRRPDPATAPPIVIGVVAAADHIIDGVGPIALAHVSWVQCKDPPQTSCKPDYTAVTDTYLVNIRRSAK